MKLPWISHLLLAGILGTSVGCAHLSANGQSTEVMKGDITASEIQQAVGKVKPALVRIKVVDPRYYSGREEKGISFGSGTIISEDGYIVTNHHVAGNAIQLMVTLATKEEIPARLVGTDPATDIAVIKLEPKSSRTFPTASFGDSESIVVGDPVLALGSPLSISQSVTLGILANDQVITPPSFRGSGFELDGESVGDLVRWLGHDAAIFPGNSGGPLVNLDGEIIGVNEIGIGLGGAIPGNLAKAVADEIIERGYVKRAYYGMSLQPLLKSSGLDRGVLIGSVMEEKPASKAGLEAGDVLLQVADEEIEGLFAEQLPLINNTLANQEVGEEVTFLILRNGEETAIGVTPEEREPAVLPTKELREWGMTARDISQSIQTQMSLESKSGVLVTSTGSGSPASKARPELKRRDIILEVNGTPIESTEQLITMTEEIVGDSEEFFPVLVKIEREGEQVLTVVEIGIDKLQSPAREVEKAWLPIETQVVTRDLAEAMDNPDLKGVRITRVYKEKPEGFSLEPGDIITHVDGDRIDAARPEDAEVFDTWIRQYKIGTDVEFTVLRDGDETTVAETLTGSPKKTREVERLRDLDFEFTAREATFNDRSKPGMQDVQFFVVVDGLTSGGWADLGGLRVGDALLKINGEDIANLQDVEDAMDRARSEELDRVVLFVRRGPATTFLEMESNW